LKVVLQNLADACELQWLISEWRKHGRLTLNNADKGDWKMLNSCIVIMVVVFLAIFSAGSCELAEERAERKRVQKALKEKYPRTY
jgi:hypothetical protein